MENPDVAEDALSRNRESPPPVVCGGYWNGMASPPAPAPSLRPASGRVLFLTGRTVTTGVGWAVPGRPRWAPAQAGAAVGRGAARRGGLSAESRPPGLPERRPCGGLHREFLDLVDVPD